METRANKHLTYEMWVEKRSRLRSGYECCCCCRCCCCCCCCVCSVLKGSHAKAFNRRHVRGACCAVCVWRGHMHQSPEHDHFFRWLLSSAAHRAPASACCISSPQNTRQCDRSCVCTLPRLRRMTLPASGGLALASPRRTGRAFGEVQVQ